MLVVLKNIALGLFVNGSFALMNFDFRIQGFVITICSVHYLKKAALNIMAIVDVVLTIYAALCFISKKDSKHYNFIELR